MGGSFWSEISFLQWEFGGPQAGKFLENVIRPSWRFVLGHPAHFIAFGGGVGLIPWAPGTFGTLLGFPLFWVLAPRVDPLGFAVAFALLFLIGVWACAVTGRHIGVADHHGMVWDETAAFVLVLWFAPDSAPWQASAFLLFRVFDIAKPPPIRHYDRTLHGGFGVMFDDLLAAFYTLLVLALVKALVD